MKTLKELLLEELTDKQKKSVDKMPVMDWSMQKLHDKVFGQGNDRVVIPFDAPDEKINSYNYSRLGHHAGTETGHVIRTLSGLGYHVNDYLAGTAAHESSPEREVKINKILDKEGYSKQSTDFKNAKGEPLTLSQVFAKDPTRTAKKNKKQIVISRNRYDVAGMSTDRDWKSCMNLVDGCNKHYVPRDLQHGTLTAYLTNAGDDQISAPLARINLKQFRSGNDTALIPENRHYGNAPPEFKEAIKDWADKNYPKAPGFYIKNPALYNDDGHSIHVEQPEKMLSNTDSIEALHKQLRPVINNIITEHVRAREERGNKFDDDGAPNDSDTKSNILYDSDKLIKTLPENIQSELAIHGIRDRARVHHSIHVDDYDNPWDNTRASDIDAHDVLHQLAAEHIDGSYDAHKHINDVMSVDDAFKHHKAIHETMGDVDSDFANEHRELKEVHATLINKILGSDHQQYKDEVVNDLNSSEDSHRIHYKNFNRIKNDTPNLLVHPLMFTNNPRVMHTAAANVTANHGHYDEALNGTLAHHLGKYADEDLSEFLATKPHTLFDENVGHNIAEFVKGTNENPNGENVQHKITQGLLLTGGHNSGQIRGLTTKNPKYSNLILRHITPANSDFDRDIFRAVAKHSRFKSVLNKLQDRPDTQDELKDELDSNKHLKESASVSYKQFLSRL